MWWSSSTSLSTVDCCTVQYIERLLLAIEKAQPVQVGNQKLRSLFTKKGGPGKLEGAGKYVTSPVHKFEGNLVEWSSLSIL